MQRETMNDIADAIADSWVVDKSRYNIKFTDLDLIIRLVKNTIRPGAYRALHGFTKKTDSSAIKRIETSQENQTEVPKRNILGIST